MGKQDRFEMEQELASDLEWMLQSGQVGPELLCEALVEEYYTPVVALGWLLLSDDAAAQRAAVDGLSSAIADRYRFQGQEDAKLWVYQHVLAALQREEQKKPGGGAMWAIQPPMDASKRIQITPQEMAPWLLGTIASLTEQQRLPLLLRYACQWPEEQIARLLRTEESAVRLRLKAALGYIVGRWNIVKEDRGAPRAGSQAGDGELTSKDIDTMLGTILPDASQPETGASLQDIAAQVLALSARKNRAGWRFSRIKEAFLVAASILGVVGVLLAADRLLPEDESGSYATKPAKAAVIVAPVSTPLPQPTPTRVPASILPMPLTSSSRPDAILERMALSESLWHTLWADVLVSQYGPASYVGPPLQYRSQVWISQPDRRLVFVGPEGGKPEYSIVRENGISSVYILGDNTNPIRNYRSPTNDPNVENLLFPGQAGYFKAKGQLQVAGTAQIAGRDVVVLVWASIPQQREFRLWIDATRGVVLRSQEFDLSKGRILVQESLITQINFDVDFPIIQKFDPPLYQTSGFFSNYQGYPEWSREKSPRPEAALGHERLDTSSLPPDGYNSSTASLVFQYPQDYLKSGSPDGRNPVVGLFADKYYLGSLKFARPWHIVCRRSPDGSKVAFSDLVGWNEFLNENWWTPRIYWFNLENLEVKSLSEAGHAHVMAFSPDSRYLAYYGTVYTDGQSGNGVYLLDTQTGSNSHLIMDVRAFDLKWSLDGRYLRVQTGPGESLGEGRHLVVDVSNGEATSDQAQNGKEIVWVPTYPATSTGIDSCATRQTE